MRLQSSKNLFSQFALGVVMLFMIAYRFAYIPNNAQNTLTVTTWDAFGYYLYLPAFLIYNDATELKWLPEIDKKYQLSGGVVYQANKFKNGNFVFKYLGGVAVIQTPLFLVGHAAAWLTGSPMDGFSPPYQYAIAFGAIFWFLIGLLVLRKVLLLYFDDKIVALTLILLCLATNLLQYAAIDNAMSHVFIFPLYSIVLWLTIRWHTNQKKLDAILIGLVVGLAVICRPTELVMLFIPLLWQTQDKQAAAAKWRLVSGNKNSVLLAVLGAFIGILPQLIYWQYATGFFVYDIGSKWFFLNPFFRVLFGLEKGLFVYTPVTIAMVAGFFFIRKKPFWYSVLVFSLLNCWIIIAWSDWKYGASFSARAFTQSYPVLALPLAALLAVVWRGKWKYLIGVIGLILIGVNFYLIKAYNAGELFIS